ncbi:MAG: Bax inhibitor-1/YccA family protein [Prevotella sp.]|nr:Bax inhibitor-1/YccA family protein [Prevotella sp.]
MEKDRLFTMIDEAESRRVALPAIMRKVYTWMALALAITGITAYGVAHSPNLVYSIFSSRWIFFGLIIAEFALVIWLTSRLHRMSITSATLLFIGYSILNGVVLSSIFLLFTTALLAKTFFICAGTFAVMSVYGAVTKRDLSSVGKLLFMALIGIILASVVNLFLKSSGLELIISYVGVLVFVGLTAWDTQKIRAMLANADIADETTHKIALLGALSLYLDFVNLFLFLLRIFGNNRN